jgi:uncharacterized protein (DUF885 family)
VLAAFHFDKFIAPGLTSDCLGILLFSLRLRRHSFECRANNRGENMDIRNLAAALVLTAATASTPFAADTAIPVPRTAAASPARQLHQLFDDYWETVLRESPTWATFLGDSRYNDRLEDASAAGILRRRQQSEDFLHRLEAIDSASLAENDKVSQAVLRFKLRSTVQGTRLLGDLPLEMVSFGSPFPVTQMDGPQFWLPIVVTGTRFAKLRDYDDYLKRLAAVPTYVVQLQQQMETGQKAGWMPPRVTLRNVPAQFATLASGDPANNPLFAPFKTFPADIGETVQQSLRVAGEEAIRDLVAPAFGGFKTFLETKYVPAGLDTIAAAKLPDGPAYYAFALEANNTTTLSAQAIHDTGIREVTRIEAEMQAVQKRTGFAGSRAEFVKYLWSDPKFFTTTPAEMLIAYRDIAKRIDPQLPNLFRELPRQPYGIRAMPKEQGDNAEQYISGADDGSRAGYFEANTNNLRRLARWEMVDLVLHEAVPGHHLQGSRAQEIKDLPAFRRNSWFPAYGEGWALYAESLGDLIGMYEDPYDKYGQLNAEMWRAARLVVDTGMHALGWSRERAIQYLKDHVTLSEEEIIAEVDRYIVWPGQATAYKIGELRILALRDKAKAALGDRFDLRAFHNALIDGGGMPLDVLEEVITRWIAAQKSAP